MSTNRFLAKYNEEEDGSGKESEYDDVLWDNFGSYESTGRVYFFVVHSPKASTDVRLIAPPRSLHTVSDHRTG